MLNYLSNTKLSAPWLPFPGVTERQDKLAVPYGDSLGCWLVDVQVQ